jgi:hypothetical protein
VGVQDRKGRRLKNNTVTVRNRKGLLLCLLKVQFVALLCLDRIPDARSFGKEPTNVEFGKREHHAPDLGFVELFEGFATCAEDGEADVAVVLERVVHGPVCIPKPHEVVDLHLLSEEVREPSGSEFSDVYFFFVECGV